MTDQERRGIVFFITGLSQDKDSKPSGMQKLSEDNSFKEHNYEVRVREYTQVKEVIQEIKEFHKSNPDGTVSIVGHSRAYELAENLDKAGIKMDKLAVIDGASGLFKPDTDFVPGNATEVLNISLDGLDYVSFYGRLKNLIGAENVSFSDISRSDASHTTIDDNKDVGSKVKQFLYDESKPMDSHQILHREGKSNTEQLPNATNSQVESHKVLENAVERQADAVNSQPETHRAHPVYEEYVNKLSHKDWTKYDPSENSVVPQDGKSQTDGRNVDPVTHDNTDTKFIDHKALENSAESQPQAQNSHSESHEVNTRSEEYVPKDFTKYDPPDNFVERHPQEGKLQTEGRNVNFMADGNPSQNVVEHKPSENPMRKETESLNSQPDGHKDIAKHNPAQNTAEPVTSDETTSPDNNIFQGLTDDMREYSRDDIPSGQPGFVEGISSRETTDLERIGMNLGDAKSLDPDTQLKSLEQQPFDPGTNLPTEGNLSNFLGDSNLTNQRQGKDSMLSGDIKSQVDMIYNEKPGEISSQKDGRMTDLANGEHLSGSQFENQINSLYESAGGDKNPEIEGYGFSEFSSNVRQDTQGIASEGYSTNQDFSAAVDNLYESFKGNGDMGQSGGGGDSVSSLSGPSAENTAINGNKPDIPNLADISEAPKKRGF